MRDNYLGAIKAMGFQEVSIIEEKSFPIDWILNNPTAKTVTKNLNIPPQKIKDVADSVVSIKVYAVKPSKKVERID